MASGLTLKPFTLFFTPCKILHYFLLLAKSAIKKKNGIALTLFNQYKVNKIQYTRLNVKKSTRASLYIPKEWFSGKQSCKNKIL